MAELVDDACVVHGQLVVDVGAGTGHITAELRRRGARVRAIELDPHFAAALRRRFAGDAGVTVVEADARSAAFPEERFSVVANLPFTGSGAIVDRLLDARSPLERADLVLEWGAARKRSELWPSTCRGVIASPYFRLWLERRLPAACFEPRPSVDAAVLVAKRRRSPQLPLADAAPFSAFVRAGFAQPRLADALRAHVAPRRLRRLADQLAFARDATPRALDGRQWVALFRETRG